MSEIYYDFTDEQIIDIINKYLMIYPENLVIFRRDKIELGKDFFVLKYYSDFNNINPNEHKIFRYIAMHNGTEIYNLYNIKSN